MARKKHNIDNVTRLAARQGLIIVIVAILSLEATALLQYYFSRKALTEEATRRAEGQLEVTELNITRVVDQVETALRNNVWAVQQQLNRPDSLAAVTTRIVRDNATISGSAVALTAAQVAPYSFKAGDEVLTSTLATQEYDYMHQEWFVKPQELKTVYWSEPYFDEGGGNMLMTTCSMPVYDKKGRLAAIFTADVSLDWLTKLVGGVKVYPTAFSTLVSREGQIMVCPVETLVMRKSAQEWAASMENEDTQVLQSINRAMLNGEDGSTKARYKGKMHYVFFAQVDVTGWSMSVVIPDDEIYGSVKRLGLMVGVLQLIGILMLILVLYYTIRSQRDMRQTEDQKTRIERELQVARGIQMSMIPKIFPPYPERSEVDMFAAMVPAKQVGGDFYDFYTRDDRLFFCIGDVSGKGVPASLVMAVTRSLFRTVSAHEKSPQRIVTAMNSSMSDMNESNMFVTLFCGVLDLRNGNLRYCNAGHNAPVVVSKAGNRFLPVIPNLPLGVLSGMAFSEQETDLVLGEGLFLYTDGLTEAENGVHELFGEERTMKALHAGLGAQNQINDIELAVSLFVAGADQSDDLTMLYIRFMNNRVTKETERHLVLHNDIQQIPQLAEFVESVAEASHLDVGLVLSLNLALEEAVTNVIMYAYPNGYDGLVDIEAIVREKELEFIISDNGIPFDPTAAPEADTTLDVDERPIGGLGIFLVRKIMDTVKYHRSEDGKNILSMTKKLS